MNNIKPYTQYKPSGIAWLGDIPEHWEQTQLNKIFQENKTKNEDLLENNLLTLSYGKIKRKDINSANGLLPASFANYQIIEKGNIVLRMLDLQNDKTSLRVGFVNEKGIITSAYIGLKSRNSNSSKYFYELLNHLDLIKHFYNGGGGVRQSISFSEIGKERVALPPLSEQEKIANFLDYKTAKIDRFIRKKKQLIKLLNEQKAGIINDAVTKGLNPNAKTKPSGIAWLGDIPEHWEEFKPKTIGYLFGGLSGKSGDDFKIENEVNISPYIPFTNIANNFIIDKRKLAYVKTIENENQNLVKKGDLLFLMSSENFEDIGKTSLLNDEIEGLFLNSFCKGFRIQNENIYPKFLNYLFSADINRKRLSIQARGFTRINLKIGKVNDLAMFAPINKSEQTAIVSHIEKETAIINKTIATIEKEIALVQEYRTALIAEAVTGKIDVRSYEIGIMCDELEETESIDLEEDTVFDNQEME